MRRMTEKGPNGYYVPADRGGATMIYAPKGEVKQRYEGEIVARLGWYEEAGMEPYEVSSINEMWSFDAIELQSLKEQYEELMTKYQELIYDLCIGDNGEPLLKLDEVLSLAKAKKEGRCIVMDSPISGTAQVLVDGKLEDRKVEKVMISQNDTFSSVSILVDKKSKRKEYPEYILRYLRYRWGLNPENTSKDDMFQSMEPKRVFREVLIWKGLLGGWDAQIIGWIKDIFGVDLEDNR